MVLLLQSLANLRGCLLGFYHLQIVLPAHNMPEAFKTCGICSDQVGGIDPANDQPEDREDRQDVQRERSREESKPGKVIADRSRYGRENKGCKRNEQYQAAQQRSNDVGQYVKLLVATC